MKFGDLFCIGRRHERLGAEPWVEGASKPRACWSSDEEEPVVCSGCGTDNRAERKFCLERGASLAAVCPSCGVANEIR